ncbi:GMC oxidoreductase [Dothidotthia symphoricarpi CBS 119687]|uniref:GMC oxidoreductase n=1 Tax=Dothidotthia symphoricarpi CBS 119687 TaxID=1392245 RepID=A0A6A6A5T9_9PLEO|nr:GMC oxidoreductase [Dothidotthia symphoricarpi CBS 119687]KAF2125971.1 GMC oxidoreductase [Dothidotthia symphoricarpi CBS 119687]
MDANTTVRLCSTTNKSPTKGASCSSPGRLTGTNFGIPGRNATYDYVIVGGGLAGSVVASRLTEHTNASVALIEAGSFYELTNGNLSQIPYWSEEWVGAGPDEWQPLIDWGLFTEPQVNGERVHYAQGKNLGGSSGRNQMMYHRPTVGSLQVWADQVGDQSWTWENMTKYYERSMQLTPNVANRTTADGSSVYDAGAFPSSENNLQPLHVSYPGYINPLSQYAAAAYSAIGLRPIPGFASGVLDGFGWWQFTIDSETGLRSSAESSFLAQAFGRPGLTTYINAQGRNIIFENGTAIGVNVTSNGQRPFTISARKEVIVSAGAFHSPQLLMVSGIGPKATLDEFAIKIVKDLPGVGQNMWDSCNVGGPVYEISVPGYSYWQQPGPMRDAEAQLLENGTGPLTNIGLDVGGWETFPDRSNFSETTQQALSSIPADWPLIENSVTSSSSILTASDSSTQYGAIGCILIAPSSRGNMTIQSASNLDPPIINPNWLGHSADEEIAIEAYRRARQAWQAIPEGIRIGDEVSPGMNVTTDAELLAHIKKNIAPIHHASSSCAMGKKDDPMAVVDSKGRVFGVQRLRVIDSSSFPFTPPGHTQGVTYAHAEKLVEDVLNDYFAQN